MSVKTINIGYSPLPKQQAAHGLSSKYRGFCGGWGNGKTSWGCAEVFMLLHEFPGTNCIIARLTRPELRGTTWDMFLNGDGSDLDTRWPGIPPETLAINNRSDLYLEFRNGSKVHGLPLDKEEKLENYNLGLFWIDQAEEVPEQIALKFQGRLRQRNTPRMGLHTFNPNGHNWLWKRYIDPKRPDVWKKLYHCVEATPHDNPFLPKDYIEQFESLPESWRQRYVDGSHDVFVGQIYTDWDPEIHVVQDFLIPRSWERWMCFDPGIRHEAAASWVARDPDGNKYYYRERLASGQTVGWWNGKINEMEAREDVGGPYEQITRRIIGPEANQRQQGDGKSVKNLFWELGLWFDDADRDPASRINAVTDHLRPKSGRFHPMAGTEPAPALYVFDSCTKLQEYLPQYRWKPVRQTYADEQAPEKPRKKDDHNVDNLGHILLDMAQYTEVETDLEGDTTPTNELDRHFLEAVNAHAPDVPTFGHEELDIWLPGEDMDWEEESVGVYESDYWRIAG